MISEKSSIERTQTCVSTVTEWHVYIFRIVKGKFTTGGRPTCRACPTFLTGRTGDSRFAIDAIFGMERFLRFISCKQQQPDDSLSF